jgi:anti-anti-sigma factor
MTAMKTNVPRRHRVREGDRVEVRTRFSGEWAGGFEVASVRRDGCRLRRVSDGSVLPVLFTFDDVRADAVDAFGRGAGADPFGMVDLRADTPGLVVRLPAILDADTVEAVRAALVRAVDTATHEVMLDVDAVEFLDSYGIRLLTTLARRAWSHDVPVRLRGGKPPVRALLDLVAVDPLFVAEACPDDRSRS